MKSAGTRSYNEWQSLDLEIGHQDISPYNDNQGNMSHWLHKVHVLTIQMGVS